MEASTYYVYPTPMGRVTIGAQGQFVTRVAFGACGLPGEERPTAVTNDASNQIQQYLAGKRRVFQLELLAEGTDFQQSVWNAVSDIPYGQTRSYSEIAAAVGSPGAARAVGMACNANPLPVVVPCHRVIGSSGKLVGYAYDIKIKAFLLDLESRN